MIQSLSDFNTWKAKMQNVWYSLYTAEELKGNAGVSVSYGGREDDQRISQICVKCDPKYIILLMLSDKY